ncbi:MAG: carboxymuconolactone decarboxylase family protein [Acidobacteriota bacterium]
MVTMARLPMAPLQPQERWQQILYKALERDFNLKPGEMDEYTRTLACSKVVVDAISAGGAHRYIMYESTLSRKLAETIGVLVSRKNRCHFCADAHTRSLEVQQGEGDLEWLHRFVEAVTADRVEQLPGYSDREKSALKFAQKAARDPKQLTGGDFDELRSAGYHDREILDILSAVALFEMHNRIVIALGLRMIERFRRHEF